MTRECEGLCFDYLKYIASVIYSFMFKNFFSHVVLEHYFQVPLFLQLPYSFLYLQLDSCPLSFGKS